MTPLKVAILIFLVLAFSVHFLTPTDDTDKSRWTRSGLSLYTDYKTGLQYLRVGMFGGLTPRLDKDGNQVSIYEEK